MALTIDQMKSWGAGHLPGLIGFEALEAGPGRLLARLEIHGELLAPNGYLHAASIVALADTACGYGTMFDLPAGATGFTTIELKTNFTGTALEGILTCEALRTHNGRTTQVWDAVVTSEASGRRIALFRCTQILLYAASPTSERV